MTFVWGLLPLELTLTTKTRSRSYDLGLYTSVFQEGPNTWTALSRHSNSKNGVWNETRTVNPDSIGDWRKKIANHDSATTSLYAERFESFGARSNGRVDLNSFRTSNGKQAEGVRIRGMLTPTLSVLVNPGFPGTLSDPPIWALRKFAAQAKSAQTALQGLVCLGEIGQTLHSMRRPLKSLYESMFKYCKAAESAARKAKRVHRLSNRAATMRSPSMRTAVQRAISGCYLESVFGWLPLMKDIDDAQKALVRAIVYRPPTEFVRAKAGDSRIGAPVLSTVSYGSVAISAVAERSLELSVKMYGQLINRSGWDGLASESGFKPADWIPTLWELLPYSFVVDYFIGLGAVIEAATINRALVAWINVGSKRTEKATVLSIQPVFQASSPSFRREGSFSPGQFANCAKVTVQRSPYTGSLVPPLEFAIPGLGMRWLNITALIGQAQATSRRIRG